MPGRDGPAPAAATTAVSRGEPTTGWDPLASHLRTSIAVLCALPREALALAGTSVPVGASMPFGTASALWVSGPGPSAAHATACEAIRGLPQGSIIVSAGVAGALAPDVGAGDVVLADRLIDAPRGEEHAIDTDTTPLHSALTHAGLRVHHAALVSSEAVVATPGAKAALRARWPSAAAVDMESAAYARAARAHGIAMVTLRVVVDESPMSIPPAALKSLGVDGETHLAPLIAALLREPLQLPALLRLGTAWRRARASLVACGKILAQFDQR